MKKLGFLMLLLTLAIMLGGTALANPPVGGGAGDPSDYFTTYFSNANTIGAPDATVRVINDGDTGANLYAAIYVFDDSEELTECCACTVTADGLTSEDVKTQLTASPLTGHIPTRGVIKVISSASPDPTAPKPTAGLRAWATHIQGAKPGTGPFIQTETAFADSNLGAAEQAALGMLCYYADTLLSGVPCSCTPKDHDF